MTTTASKYMSVIAAMTAAAFGRKQPVKVVPRQPAKHAHRPLSLAERIKLAFSAFPNHHGNYLGKRPERRPGVPLTADERFYRLAGEHECRARAYRWKPAALLG